MGRKNVLKAAVCILLFSMSLGLFGCSAADIAHVADREVFGPRAVNDFIDQMDKDLDEITELICDPGEDTSISSSYYDKLGKLKNLESVTFVGISCETDAQNFFGELAKLDNLKSVTIKSSRIGSVSRLKDIESLEELHIITGMYSGDRYKISDLDELYEIKNLRVLDLQNVFQEVPVLRGIDNLEELTLSSYDMHEVPYETANWGRLKYLSFEATGISKIDDRILSELNSLETLDISYSAIEDVSFVLDLPGLKDFSYRKHSIHEVDMEVLKQHPNYDESWIAD